MTNALTTPTTSQADAKPFKPKFHQRIGLFLQVLVAGHLVSFVAIGIYTVALETHILLQLHIGHWMVGYHIDHAVATNTVLWHYLVPLAFIRHGYRNVGEAIFKGMVVLTFALSPYSKRRVKRLQKGPTTLQKVMMRLRLPTPNDNEFRAERGLKPLSWQQAVYASIVGLALAGIVVFLGLHVIDRIHQYSISPAGPAWLRQQEGVWTGPLAYSIVGLVASPFAKFPISPVIDEAEEQAAQKHVLRNKRFHWYHHLILPYHYFERVRRVEAQGQAAAAANIARRGHGLRIFVGFVALAALVFFIVGVQVVTTNTP